MLRLFDWLCYHVWMVVPYRWHPTPWAMWLLQYAGRHAYRGSYCYICAAPEVFGDGRCWECQQRALENDGDAWR